MENLTNKDSFIEGKNIALALSGGMDSVVLLHYLWRYFAKNLRIIHCHHHLSEHADAWEDFCQNLAKSLNIPYTTVDIFIKSKSNIEETARKKRYLALADTLNKNEILCTAHHQNDQAETLLLQLFRGSGMAGLAAMPTTKPLGKGVHYRPLLNINKTQIITYAKQNNLQWIEDDSNTNTDFRRNFLRLEIIPQLAKVYQNLTQTLSRSARHQAQALQLTQTLAALDIEQYQLITSNNLLDGKKLAKMESARAINILRYQLNTLNFPPPSDKIMQQMIDLLSAKEDANPLVCWQGFELRRYQNELYFINSKIQKNDKYCPFYTQFKDLPNFSIRYRQQGQRVILPNKSHSQSLKKVLQDAHIPPWERNQLKMYYIKNELKAMERIGKIRE